MAEIIRNEKGFKVIKTSISEINQSVGGLGICDKCNVSSFTGYYVAVLNYWICEECYNEFLGRAKRYKEDTEIEQRNYDYMLNAFERSGIKVINK